MDAKLADDIIDLLPELRPYQRRAAYWMVQREKGDPITLEDNQFISPLSISVEFLDSATKMFFNPFRLVENNLSSPFYLILNYKHLAT